MIVFDFVVIVSEYFFGVYSNTVFNSLVFNELCFCFFLKENLFYAGFRIMPRMVPRLSWLP